MMYAECELSVLGRPCLDRRIADRQTLKREVAHWEHTRNSQKIRVDWQFTMADARIKLKRLYPVLGRVCKLTMDPRHSSIRLFRKAASELLCKHALEPMANEVE
jgi:hypothetical protein